MTERPHRRPTLDFVSDEIVASHAEIHRIIDETLERLSRIASEGPPNAHQVGELGRLLHELSEQMRMHFQSEERSGFFRLVQHHLPDMKDEVDLLRREHGDIHKILVACLACMNTSPAPNVVQLTEHIESLRHKLEPHEATEDLLLTRLAAVTASLRGATPPTPR